MSDRVRTTLTANEVCEVLEISARTLRRMVRRQQLSRVFCEATGAAMYDAHAVNTMAQAKLLLKGNHHVSERTDE